MTPTLTQRIEAVADACAQLVALSAATGDNHARMAVASWERELRQIAAEVQDDSKRLNWLEQNYGRAATDHNPCCTFVITWGPHNNMPPLREVIDGFMRLEAREAPTQDPQA